MNETKSTLLTVKQVAERLQFSISTVYSLATSGAIPSYKLGGSIRFKGKEIEDWIERNKREQLQTEAKDVLGGKRVDFDEIFKRASN